MQKIKNKYLNFIFPLFRKFKARKASSQSSDTNVFISDLRIQNLSTPY